MQGDWVVRGGGSRSFLNEYVYALYGGGISSPFNVNKTYDLLSWCSLHPCAVGVASLCLLHIHLMLYVLGPDVDHNLRHRKALVYPQVITHTR